MEKQIEKIKGIVNELPLTTLLGRTILQERKFTRDIVSLYEGWYPPEAIRQIKERYITAHCNPDFKGDKIKFIFDNVEGK